MKTDIKGILAALMIIVAVVILADMAGSKAQGSLSSVIHMAPIPSENIEAAHSDYLVVLWDQRNLESLSILCPREETEEFRLGDKLMVYKRRGWLTGIPYSETIQGNYAKY